MTLGTGEALTSFLDEDGVPSMVEHTSIICPESRMAPCDEATRTKINTGSMLASKYTEAVDNESAYEMLEKEAEKQAELDEIERQKAELEAERKKFEEEKAKAEAEAAKKAEKEAEKKAKEEEKKKAQKEKAAERRRNKIETQLISAGGQVLKRGLLNILKKL